MSAPPRPWTVRSAAGSPTSTSRSSAGFTGGRIVVDETVQGLPAEKAQIRLIMAGDDLVAMVNGGLNFAKAWGSGRVKLEANVFDLFRLRKLL